MTTPADNRPGTWFFVDATNGPRQLRLRLRIDRPDARDIDNFRTAVAIQWQFAPQEGTFAPPDADAQRMARFEATVEELAGGGGYSYLMNIGTGLGLKEWVYYTNDQSQFMSRLNQLLTGSERYPLKIEFYDDPDWQVWGQLMNAYRRCKPAGAG